MLNKVNRLNKTRDFDRAFKGGKSAYGKQIGIKAIANKVGKSRFGIVVSTKVAKKATDRNQLKRRIREILRLNVDKIKAGHDIMIIALPGTSEAKYQELEKEIEGGLNKLRLL